MRGVEAKSKNSYLASDKNYNEIVTEVEARQTSLSDVVHCVIFFTRTTSLPKSGLKLNQNRHFGLSCFLRKSVCNVGERE